ncbi:uncharacterized protein TNCV_1946941 [Trichonephila clavipes]|nr:uncharacterized protein TNCV_1946941 [Trichonephila clavipes]
MAPRPLHQLCEQCDVEQCGGLYRSPGHLHTRTRRSCRCSGVKGSARKGHLDLRFASARCLEIVCGTIATPTSARIVERVTVGSTSASRTILRSSLLVVLLVAPDPVFRTWVPSHVHCSQQFLTAHSERSNWSAATRRVDQPAVYIPMISSLSNSLNSEKCLLARLPDMFRLPKSSYNRRPKDMSEVKPSYRYFSKNLKLQEGSTLQLSILKQTPMGTKIKWRNFWKNPEAPKLRNMVANDAKVPKLAANSVTKNDANLTLSPRFHQVLIESPL